MVGKKNLDQRSLKSLLKSDRKKSTVEPTAMCNSERKSISTRTMQRGLKGLRLNSSAALRNHISMRLIWGKNSDGEKR